MGHHPLLLNTKYLLVFVIPLSGTLAAILSLGFLFKVSKVMPFQMWGLSESFTTN